MTIPFSNTPKRISFIFFPIVLNQIINLFLDTNKAHVRQSAAISMKYWFHQRLMVDVKKERNRLERRKKKVPEVKHTHIGENLNFCGTRYVPLNRELFFRNFVPYLDIHLLQKGNRFTNNCFPIWFWLGICNFLSYVLICSGTGKSNWRLCFRTG